MNRDLPLHLVFVADVGDRHAYHVGDEAMLAANLDGLRARCPGMIATIAGKGSYAGFESADGFVISGGGNLCASWPEHVHQRAAIAELAHRRGKPVVILGQTLGPDLTEDLEAMVAVMLRRAALVGVRELSSYALALALGVPHDRLLYQTDDAMFLDATPITESWAEPLRRGSAPWIAITIDSGVPLDDELTRQLSRLVEATQARLVFIPHVIEDLKAGRALKEKLPEMTLCDVLEARQACWLTRQAALIVSARYHPIVFGLSAGVPCVGVALDEYRRVKLRGALVHAGMPSCLLSFRQARAGALFQSAAALYQRRDEVRRELHSVRDSWREAETGRWQRVMAALRGQPLGDCVGRPTPASAVFDELDARRRFHSEERLRHHEQLQELSAHVLALETARQEAECYAQSLRAEHDKLAAMRCEAERYAQELEVKLGMRHAAA